MKSMTPQVSGRSVVQVLGVRMDTGVVPEECNAPDERYMYITPAWIEECGISVVEILLVTVNIRVVVYEAMTHSVGDQWFSP